MPVGTALGDNLHGADFTTTNRDATYDLAELNREQAFGGIGTTKARDVPRINLIGFDAPKAEIADQLWRASTEIGFFQLVNHGIPQEEIDEAFTMTERFFALPHEKKARYPLLKGANAGWEYKSQVRPSTRTPDQKESFKVTLPRMAGLWPTGDELPGFKAVMLAFERANWVFGMKVLSCFARSVFGRISSQTVTIRSRANTRARCGFCIICRW